jgi:predicted permease
MSNLKLAVRMLLKTPLVSLIAIVSLALGIGANTAIFSIFHQMLLRALPVQEPEHIVNLSAPGPKPGSLSNNMAGKTADVFSYQMFRDLEKAQSSFTGIAAHRLFSANLAARDQTMNGDGLLVSGSYFPLLGVRPALGRLLTADDDRILGESHVVVLSHAYWQTRFGRDPGMLNESLIINGQVMTIVGVAQRGFDGTTLGSKPQVFVPITMRGLMQPGFKSFEDRRNYWAYLFARLKPGVLMEQAHAVLNGQYQSIINNIEAPLQKGMSESTMKRFRAKSIVLNPGTRGQSNVSGEAEMPLRLLLGVTALVLIIACANVANLLLARSAARASEMAVRLSVGASRPQLIMQLLAESLLLAVIAGAAGILVARWTLHLIASMLPSEAALTLQFELEIPALFFTAAVTLGTGLFFGLFPALHSTRPDLVTALKDQAGQPSGARAAARFRTALATAQIALSLALLVGAGLFIRSLVNISRVDLGLKVDHVVTFSISPILNGYTPQRSLQLFERLEDEIAAMPGVTGVSGSLVPVLSGSSWGQDVSVQGYKMGPDTDMNSRYNELGPGYFRTLGIPLMSGREFVRSDVLSAPKVAIVNEAFAKKFNLGRDAVGKRISNRGAKLDTEIVGLVQNAKYDEVKAEVPPMFFRPFRQDEQLGYLTFYARTALVPEQLLPQLAKVVARLDPNLPVENLRTMPQQVRENVFLDSMVSVLSTAFACLATLLAAVGLYGVLAYTVAQRTREIGLRMALGASPPRVRAMVLQQVGKMTLVGGVIGLALAIIMGRYAESQLYQLKGADPIVMTAASVVLVLVSMAAGFFPAHHASKVDPMQALRHE